MAAAALVLGGGTAAVLLTVANPDAGTASVYVAARDLPAGAQVSPDAVRLQPMRLGPGLALAFGPGSAGQLYAMRATHDLAAGQLIQRSDLAAATRQAERRSVLLPVRSAPPLAAGDHVDLLAVTGQPDHVAIVPFATDLVVNAQVGGALVVSVDPQQAAALAYAALTLPLVAVATTGRGGGEEPVATVQQASDLVRR